MNKVKLYSPKYRKQAVSSSAMGAIIAAAVIIAAVAGYYALVTPSQVTTSFATSASTLTSTSTSVSTTTATSTTTSIVTTTPTISAVLTGAGSTFVYPLMSAQIVKYQTLRPTVQINYQSIGSGGGIAALEGKTVDFAASDAPLQAADQTKAPNVLTIPVTIGAVTIAYNIPGVGNSLHLTGQLIADIFAGNVTVWNDPAIQNLNTNMTLPAKSILVVHRSDGSGTTFTFTGYLTLVSQGWAKTIGQGKTVGWPVGLGAAGNEGVAGVVRGTAYTVGYVELAYAIQNKMAVASIRNHDGNFVLPSLASTSAAAQSIPNLPPGNGDWSKVNLLNEPGATSYPITTFVYIFVYKDLSVLNGMTKDKATAVVQFFWWLVHDGQQVSSGLSYVPLPQNVVSINESTIQSLTFNGEPLPTT